MAAMTNYLANKIRDHVLRNTAYTSPTTVYLALFTTPTTEAGGGTEVTGGSYARQAITFSTTANPGEVTQTALLTFPLMPSCTITHIAIMDASTSGNMLMFGALPSSLSVVAGTPFYAPAAAVSALFD